MPPSGDSDADDRVLSPDELDIEAREEVASIGEDRYVIGPDGPPNAPKGGTGDDRETARDETAGDESADPPTEAEKSADSGDSTRASETASPDGKPAERRASPANERTASVTGRDVKRWLSEELAAHDSAYAYRIAAKSGDAVNHQQLETDDIGAAFDGLLVWYAQQVASGTPVDEALGILLAESSVQARYPTSRLVAYLEAHDLGPEDSIRELVETVADADGLTFPNHD